MSHFTVISNKNHATQNRPLNPLDVIEQWSLCGDLGQMILCLERAGRRYREDAEAGFQELWSAWKHLSDKYINECMDLTVNRKDIHAFCKTSLIQQMRASPFPMMAESIAKNWGLSNHLKEVIFYITLYKNFYFQFPYMGPVFLKQALRHMDKEMNEKRQLLTSLTED